MIVELAGLAISGFSLALDLKNSVSDWMAWKEQDIEADMAWLEVALAKGVLSGQPDDFAWLAISRLPRAELEGTHSAVLAENREKRIRYRIVTGHGAGRLILTKRLSA